MIPVGRSAAQSAGTPRRGWLGWLAQKAAYATRLTRPVPRWNGPGPQVQTKSALVLSACGGPRGLRADGRGRLLQTAQVKVARDAGDARALAKSVEYLAETPSSSPVVPSDLLDLKTPASRSPDAVEAATHFLRRRRYGSRLSAGFGTHRSHLASEFKPAILRAVYCVPMTHPELDRTLRLHHAAEITDSAELTTFAATADDETNDVLASYISEKGRVLAWRTATGARVLYEESIFVDEDFEWSPSGAPRVYRFETADPSEVTADVRRLFLSQSLRNGGARAVAGWRGRVVALIPEEVGAKESNVFRTLPGGAIDTTHTYNVLDAYSKYSGWVHELAEEFGGTDEKLVAGIETPDISPFPDVAAHVAQAWLLREAADAELQQARHSLKFGLAGFSLLSSRDGADPGVSISELARSLHTDRPNLARAVKAAEGDRRVREAMGRLDRPAH